MQAEAAKNDSFDNQAARNHGLITSDILIQLHNIRDGLSLSSSGQSKKGGASKDSHSKDPHSPSKMNNGEKTVDLKSFAF